MSFFLSDTFFCLHDIIGFHLLSAERDRREKTTRQCQEMVRKRASDHRAAASQAHEDQPRRPFRRRHNAHTPGPPSSGALQTQTGKKKIYDIAQDEQRSVSLPSCAYTRLLNLPEKLTFLVATRKTAAPISATPAMTPMTIPAMAPAERVLSATMVPFCERFEKLLLRDDM